MKIRRARILAATSAVSGAALLSAAALFVTSAPTAQAVADQGRHDRFPLSVAELDARRAEVFARVDANGDGLISAEEFSAAELPKPPRGGHDRRQGHRPERGEPSAEMIAERAAARAAMEENLFHTLDENADGVISRDEFSNEAMREARKASMKAQLFERADQDGDGYLSPAEFPPRRLADLDANGDGEISRDELPERAGGRSWGGGAS